MNNHKKQNAIKQLNGILKELENPQNHLNDSLPLQLAELLKLFLGSESILYKQVIDLLHSRTKGGFFPNKDHYSHFTQQLLTERVLFAKQITKNAITFIENNGVYKSSAPIKNIFSSLENNVLIPSILVIIPFIVTITLFINDRSSVTISSPSPSPIKHHKSTKPVLPNKLHKRKP